MIVYDRQASLYLESTTGILISHARERLLLE